MNQILETNIVVLFWRRYLYKWYGSMEQSIGYICQSSRTDRLIKRFWEKIKICFRYSFLGRITEIKEANPALLDNSQTARYLIGFYKRWRDKIVHYSKTSSTIGLVKDMKEQLNLSPVKMLSIITVTTITINLTLSFIFQKQIGLWGWLVRGLFLFTGLGGLSCNADWLVLKKSSIFLRKI